MIVRRENCGWGVGKIIEGKDLVNSRTYQEMLSVCRRKQSWNLTDKHGIDGCQLEENKQVKKMQRKDTHMHIMMTIAVCIMITSMIYFTARRS